MTMKIAVMKDGPYLVTGNVPLYKRTIVFKDGINVLHSGTRIETDEPYYLCRCGKSKTAPFCDGAHEEAGFVGTETADRRDYDERARKMRGQQIDLLDDNRCAFARFCHRQHGSVWELVEYSSNDEEVREAIDGSNACPTGRLVAVTKMGEEIEPELPAEISVVQDPQRGVSAGIYVTGYIPLEGADGCEYELRNRYALCRCGRSKSTPFCDAMHVTFRYKDGMQK